MQAICEHILLFFPGVVNVIYRDSASSQPYRFNGVAGEPTTTSLPEGFPQNCTTCESGLPTEYCDHKKQLCVKLTGRNVSILSTNVSLRDGSPYPLDGTTCTPRYLHQENKMTYAIVCEQSFYQHFHLREDGSPELGGISQRSGVGGILVQGLSSSSNHPELYHVEIQENPSYAYIITYEVYRHHEGQIFPEYGFIACSPDSLTLHPAFSLTGRFFLYCLKYNNQAYFWCSVYTTECIELELCSDPLPSPPGHAGIGTFYTVCGNTITIHNTNNVAEKRSLSFNSSISSHTYLDRNTLVVSTENQQHILTVNKFLKSNSSGDVLTLENTTYCSLQKLISPDVYATACQNDSSYNIRLVSVKSRQSLGTIEGLPEEPRGIYFNAQEPPPPSSPTSLHTPESTENGQHATERQLPVTTFTLTTTTDATANPTTTTPPTPTAATGPKNELIVILTIVSCVVFVVVAIGLFIFICNVKKKQYCNALCRKERRPEQVCEEGNSKDSYMMGLNPTMWNLTDLVYQKATDSESLSGSSGYYSTELNFVSPRQETRPPS